MIVPNLADIDRAIRDFSGLPQPHEIRMHPNAVSALMAATADPTIVGPSGRLGVVSLWGVPLVKDADVPEGSVDVVYRSPALAIDLPDVGGDAA